MSSKQMEANTRLKTMNELLTKDTEGLRDDLNHRGAAEELWAKKAEEISVIFQERRRQIRMQWSSSGSYRGCWRPPRYGA